MHSRKIIVQNITNLTDARYFAAWGVDYLSYNLDPASEYAITMETAMEISGWVEGPKTLIESKSIDYLDGVDGHILDESFSSLPLSKEAFFRTTLDRLQAGLTQGAYILKVDRDNLDAMKALTHEERLGTTSTWTSPIWTLTYWTPYQKAASWCRAAKKRRWV